MGRERDSDVELWYLQGVLSLELLSSFAFVFCASPSQRWFARLRERCWRLAREARRPPARGCPPGQSGGGGIEQDSRATRLVRPEEGSRRSEPRISGEAKIRQGERRGKEIQKPLRQDVGEGQQGRAASGRRDGR